MAALHKSMKKDLKKELIHYSSAAAALLGVAEVNGQYQYTNITDTTVDYNNGFYNLDLDQDGENDFTLRQYVDTGAAGNTNAVIIQPYTNTINRVAGEKQGQYNYPFNLMAATVVDNTTDWDGIGGQFTTGYMAFVVDGQAYPNSNWIGPISDGYLGLQLVKPTGVHYGWARLSISEDCAGFTVRDFAVNLTADSSIVVGAELLGDIENLLSRVQIAVKPGELMINHAALDAEIVFRLVGINGSVLKTESASENGSTLISISDLPLALYILEIESNGLVRREKLVL